MESQKSGLSHLQRYTCVQVGKGQHWLELSLGPTLCGVSWSSPKLLWRFHTRPNAPWAGSRDRYCTAGDPHLLQLTKQSKSQPAHTQPHGQNSRQSNAWTINCMAFHHWWRHTRSEGRDELFLMNSTTKVLLTCSAIPRGVVSGGPECYVKTQCPLQTLHPIPCTGTSRGREVLRGKQKHFIHG